MRKVIFPGSFDPLTNGHLDIIRRASRLFDSVEVAIGVNSSKNCLFTPEERKAMIEETVAGIPNVTVAVVSGLMVDHAKKSGASWIIKGLRDSDDFKSEHEMELNNTFLSPEVETLYFSSRRENISTRSSSIKEFLSYGVDVTQFLPDPVARVVKERFLNNQDSAN